MIAVRIRRALLAATFVAVAVGGPASAGRDGDVTVSVAPSRVVLDGASQTAVSVTNSGSARTTIDVRIGNYVILADGRVRIDPKLPPGRSAKHWLTVSPRRVDLAPGETAEVTVTSRPPRSAAPGDHHALLLLSSVPRSSSRVAIRTRVGVTTLVRVGGPVLRQLRPLGLSVKTARNARFVRFAVENRGNVNERFVSARTTLVLRQAGKVVATLHAGTRSILPGTRGDLVFVYRGKVRGDVTAVARVRPARAADAGPGATTTPSTIVARGRLRL